MDEADAGSSTEVESPDHAEPMAVTFDQASAAHSGVESLDPIAVTITDSESDCEEGADEMDATPEFEGSAEDQEYFADDVDDAMSDEVNSSETSSNASESVPLSSEDQPLYDGARLSVGTSMLLIATFVLRHGLTGEAIFDLLTLVELHCLAGNLCRSTVRLYKDFFSRVKMPVQRHFFCKKCSQYSGTAQFDKCPLCGHEGCDYFIVVPLMSQLQSLLKGRKHIHVFMCSCCLMLMDNQTKNMYVICQA